MLFPLDSIRAECIFAPLHDPIIARDMDIRVVAGAGSNVQGMQQWCWYTLTWSSALVEQAAAYLTVPFCAEAHDFDHLIACVTVPKNTSVALEMCIEEAWIQVLAPRRGVGTRVDLVAPLSDQSPTKVRLAFIPHESGATRVITHWLGMGNSQRLKIIKDSKPVYSPEWIGLIKPKGDWREPRFSAELLFSANDLEFLRFKRDLPRWKDHFDLLEKRARRAIKYAPEDQLTEYAAFTDERYIRQREQGRWSYYLEGPLVSVVGLILKDDSMIHWACRVLMCMVHTTFWCQSAESRLPGSTWNQLCFVEEEMTSAVAIMADCLDHALTDRARDLIRCSIWEKGLAVIERDMMRHEHVYHMNQGIWFGRACVLGGLFLEKAWPRMDGYVERSATRTRNILSEYIQVDGGTDEGLGYWSLAMHMALQGLIAYSRGRACDVKSLLPANQSRSEEFLSIMSAMRPGRVLMSGDNSTDYLVGDTISILSKLYPESVYAEILGGCLLEEREFTYFNHYIADGIWSFVLGPLEIPPMGCVVPTFDILETTGQATSLRACGERSTRIHFYGSKECPSHSHSDRSSFTLELDGQWALIDRGVVRYDDPRSDDMAKSSLHNILTPVHEDGTFAEQSSPRQPIIPHGYGDDTELHLAMDISSLWEEELSACSRSIESSEMARFSVIDRGCRITPGKVAFHLHAPVPFQIVGKTALLNISGSTLKAEFPWADSISQSSDGIDYLFQEVFHLVAVRDVGNSEYSIKTTFERQL